jgi:hypothetical protein
MRWTARCLTFGGLGRWGCSTSRASCVELCRIQRQKLLLEILPENHCGPEILLATR